MNQGVSGKSRQEQQPGASGQRKHTTNENQNSPKTQRPQVLPTAGLVVEEHRRQLEKLQDFMKPNVRTG
jgi:hypothetical protein